MSEHTLTPAEQQLIADGFADLYRGRLIPIMRGGDETDEERAERERQEEAERARNEKKLSQADVDRIVADRLARDRKDRPSEDEIKELRSAKDELDKIKDENKSELEKQQQLAATAQKERDDAREALKAAKVTNAILAEASKADRKIVDPDAVLSLIDKSSLTLDDDGTPTNIAEAMDSLLEKRPYLVATNGGNGRGNAADLGARGEGGDGQLASTEGMTPEQIVEASEKGQFDTYLGTPNK